MLNAIRTHWPMVSTLSTLAFGVVVYFLTKTYAKREELSTLEGAVVALKGRMVLIESKIDSLPTKEELHALQLSISDLRGELRAIAPELRQVKHINGLLLDNELKERNK